MKFSLKQMSLKNKLQHKFKPLLIKFLKQKTVFRYTEKLQQAQQVAFPRVKS